MSWEDRDYSGGGADQRLGRPGGDWRGMRPTFDNPITWALSLGRIGGILVRVHLFFILFIVITILRSLSSPGSDLPIPEWQITVLAMGVLFVVVLAHEFGHCLACRWGGGQADEILMWPLGGLAYCSPGPSWQAHLGTALGGPAVNVILCTVSGTILGMLTGHWLGVALPNPLHPLDGLAYAQVSKSFAHMALFFTNEISLMLLLFNLLPIFPLDGGRIVQAMLWPKYGWSRSMVFSVRAGYVGSILLFIFGAVTSMWSLVGIALFGAMTCYITQKQVQWSDAASEFSSDEYALSLHQTPDEEASAATAKPSRRALRQAQREQQEAAEVDRILQKIAATGIDSLTRSEKALLRRVTERKRHEG